MSELSDFEKFFKGKPPVDRLIREKKTGEGWTVVEVIDDRVIIRHHSAAATTRMVSKQDLLTKYELVGNLIK
jgi:hypothetical protein